MMRTTVFSICKRSPVRTAGLASVIALLLLAGDARSQTTLNAAAAAFRSTGSAAGTDWLLSGNGYVGSFIHLDSPQTLRTHFNMLQPEKIEELRAYCQAHGIGAVVYWVFMKGLLAGKLHRNHAFDAADRRLTYPVYQGQRWEVAQALLDRLRQIAEREGRTVASLVVAWTLRQPGISAVLVGAKRPAQIEESAAAMRDLWSDDTLTDVDRMVAAARARYAELDQAVGAR